MLIAVSTFGCLGRPSGISYPDIEVDTDDFTETPEGESDPWLKFNRYRFTETTCKDANLSPVTATLAPKDFTNYVKAQGLEFTLRKARTDLYFYDVPDGDGGIMRLRLAILGTPEAAAKYLHASLLEHGPGWWGLRRSNLAVLAPKASLRTLTKFVAKYHLHCFGMVATVGADDVYVISGPYAQL